MTPEDESRIRQIVREELAALKPQKGNRGTRLPSDFTLPPEWALWAQEKRFWTVEEAKAEGELFCDYWTSRGGVMQDWRRCWMTWVRNSRRPDGERKLAPVMSHSELAEHYEKTAALYDRMGRWQEAKELRARIGV